MKRRVLDWRLRVLIPCCRLHSWEDELSTASPTTAFAVKHAAGTPSGDCEGSSRWMRVGSRESKEELTISCRDSPPVGSGSVPRETPMSAELRVVSPSPELCVPLHPGTEPASRETRTTAEHRGGPPALAAGPSVSRETAGGLCWSSVALLCFTFPIPCCRPWGSVSPEELSP